MRKSVPALARASAHGGASRRGVLQLKFENSRSPRDEEGGGTAAESQRFAMPADVVARSFLFIQRFSGFLDPAFVSSKRLGTWSKKCG